MPQHPRIELATYDEAVEAKNHFGAVRVNHTGKPCLPTPARGYVLVPNRPRTHWVRHALRPYVNQWALTGFRPLGFRAHRQKRNVSGKSNQCETGFGTQTQTVKRQKSTGPQGTDSSPVSLPPKPLSLVEPGAIHNLLPSSALWGAAGGRVLIRALCLCGAALVDLRRGVCVCACVCVSTGLNSKRISHKGKLMITCIGRPPFKESDLPFHRNLRIRDGCATLYCGQHHKPVRISKVHFAYQVQRGLGFPSLAHTRNPRNPTPRCLLKKFPPSGKLAPSTKASTEQVSMLAALECSLSSLNFSKLSDSCLSVRSLLEGELFNTKRSDPTVFAQHTMRR